VGTSALYAALGELAEATVLFVSILPLAGMDAWLHQRTRASTEGLRTRLASRARVVRDGSARDVSVAEVVPGDLALVAAGEPFPADGVIVDAGEAQVDESALTGESLPVRKLALQDWPGGGGETPVDSESWGFAGTRLLTGRAALRVARTGAETLYGEIVRSAVQGSHARTPLQTAIGGLVRALIVVAAVFCVALAAIRLVQGHGFLDALVSAMTLAVAALPEEFPVVFTVFLGVGVHRLAKRKALVRRAVSVENVGRVSTLCSDETGTITEGRLELTHVLPPPAGSRSLTLRVAALASRSDAGDPLDAAVLALADGEAGAPVRAVTLQVFPFTEDRKRETAVVEESGALLVATKGSHEVVLAVCELTAQ
jgi:Ca2+-transporting ATPase